MSSGGTNRLGRVVAFGMANYDEAEDWNALSKIEKQMDALHQVLSEVTEGIVVIRDATRAEAGTTLNQLTREMNSASWRGPLLVVWGGHGASEDSTTVRLVVRDSQKPLTRVNCFAPEDLTEFAIATGADQVLLVFDTCRAGAGLPPAIFTAVKQLERKTFPTDSPPWFGTMAASSAFDDLDNEYTVVDLILRVLTDGPTGAAGSAPAWSMKDKFITGQQLMHGIALSAEDQALRDQLLRGQVQSGVSYRPFLVNPLWDPDAGEQIMSEVLNDKPLFVGRRRVLGAVVRMLDVTWNGLLAITGTAGMGKTTLIRRIVDLTDPGRHTAIRDGYGSTSTDDVPLPRPAYYVTARNLTAPILTARLAELLGSSADASVLGLVEAVKALPRCMIAVDGLDEAAPAERGGILETLTTLAAHAHVIVSSRPEGADGEAIDERLASIAPVIDLNEDADLEKDLEEFIRRFGESS